jgi:phosphoribosylamine--glycine ligase
MEAAGVPTARARLCASAAHLKSALDEFGAPFVVKDDGLAAGKGVVVTEDRGDAFAHGSAILGAGGSVVVEEYLDGPEVSIFCISDGSTVVALEPAQDFKRVGDGDAGPNTGGMGAYSPLPWAPASLVEDVLTTVARPTIAEMARRGTPFQGVLYCGLALTPRGTRVIEFNARFGDPETQSVLARLVTPLSTLLHAAATGTLGSLAPLVWSPESAVTVVIAANRYPGKPAVGDPIRGTEAAEGEAGVHVLQAGTAIGDDGALVSAGGRVLSVVGVGEGLIAARERAYAGVARIELDGSHYRTDIALSAANLED